MASNLRKKKLYNITHTHTQGVAEIPLTYTSFCLSIMWEIFLQHPVQTSFYPEGLIILTMQKKPHLSLLLLLLISST